MRRYSCPSSYHGACLFGSIYLQPAKYIYSWRFRGASCRSFYQVNYAIQQYWNSAPSTQVDCELPTITIVECSVCSKQLWQQSLVLPTRERLQTSVIIPPSQKYTSPATQGRHKTCRAAPRLRGRRYDLQGRTRWRTPPLVTLRLHHTSASTRSETYFVAFSKVSKGRPPANKCYKLSFRMHVFRQPAPVRK